MWNPSLCMRLQDWEASDGERRPVTLLKRCSVWKKATVVVLVFLLTEWRLNRVS